MDYCLRPGGLTHKWSSDGRFSPSTYQLMSMEGREKVSRSIAGGNENEWGKMHREQVVVADHYLLRALSISIAESL